MKIVSRKATRGLIGHLQKNDQQAAMGDKSISHRALMFASMARGVSRINGLLESEDTLRTQTSMKALGIDIKKNNGDYIIDSAGFLSFRQPSEALNMGNSGTSARLLIGLLSGSGYQIKMFGDPSLSKRPIDRIMTPLSNMGVIFHAHKNNFLPLSFFGQPPLLPIDYTLPIASAQIKSAILLAGLSALGETTIWEKDISRDHSERMLSYLGVDIHRTTKDKYQAITIKGGTATLENIIAKDITIPRDISSVAFLLVAASIIPNSDLIIDNVGLNPTRDGVIETLLEMGADITITYDSFSKDSEPTGRLHIKSAELQAVKTDASRAPRMIDEYPILAMAAAVAKGVSLFQGLKELRVKESDRLAAIANGLSAIGVAVKTGNDWLEITGGKKIIGNHTITTNLDHRIAMSFYILGLIADKPITIDDDSAIATSFPNFLPLMKRLLTA
ncbi:MAG: 3-phosphoshikimate 1-carboxyvinyltransferase [Alphaproteobacteria bacterium]